MQIIGIKRDEGRFDIWRVTFDGYSVGDSRGYTRSQALAQAEWLVSRDDERQLDPVLVEEIEAADAADEASYDYFNRYIAGDRS